MKIYEVGGAVRDELLGVPVKDRDFVVVGSTPEEMTRLGYTPVGKDFPVFLHPATHAEYALARTERKTARGYHGFQIHATPEVTLEQDLLRRDLTINAIAKDDHGDLIDPFHGVRDLRDKVLRHVSDAFAEDPVRVLRVARFAARYADFSVAAETFALMRAMAANGEVDALVAERVWQEIAKGLMEKKPSRMFDVLIGADALRRIVPEFSAMGIDDIASARMDRAAQDNAPLAVRYATLIATLDSRRSATRADLHDANTKPGAPLAARRLRVPSECADLARLAVRWRSNIQNALRLSPDELLSLLLGADALRRPTRFHDLLTVNQYISAANSSAETNYLREAQSALAAVDTKGIVAQTQNAADIPASIRAAQLEKIHQFIAAKA